MEQECAEAQRRMERGFERIFRLVYRLVIPLRLCVLMFNLHFQVFFFRLRAGEFVTIRRQNIAAPLRDGEGQWLLGERRRRWDRIVVRLLGVRPRQ